MMRQLASYRHAGKALMVIAALLSATGQFLWKLGSLDLLYLALGGLCYVLGGVFMIRSFALEKLSVAYPLMCTGYIFALFYGDLFLGEPITLQKGAAVALMTLGVTFISYES